MTATRRQHLSYTITPATDPQTRVRGYVARCLCGYSTRTIASTPEAASDAIVGRHCWDDAQDVTDPSVYGSQPAWYRKAAQLDVAAQDIRVPHAVGGEMYACGHLVDGDEVHDVTRCLGQLPSDRERIAEMLDELGDRTTTIQSIDVVERGQGYGRTLRLSYASRSSVGRYDVRVRRDSVGAEERGYPRSWWRVDDSGCRETRWFQTYDAAASEALDVVSDALRRELTRKRGDMVYRGIHSEVCDPE
jgi:hypothetical protein